MAQQTAIGRSRTAVQREKRTRKGEKFWLSAQKRFLRTLRIGAPLQAVIVMTAVGMLSCARMPGGLFPLATAAFTACLLHAFSVPAAFIGCLIAVAGGFSMTDYLRWWQLSACAAIWLVVPCRKTKDGALWWAMMTCGVACAVPTFVVGVQSVTQAMVGLANAGASMAMVPVFERTLLAAKEAQRKRRADDVLCVWMTCCGVIAGMWTLGMPGRWIDGFVCAMAVTTLARIRRDEGRIVLFAAVLGGVMYAGGGRMEWAGLFAGAMLCVLPGVPSGKYTVILFLAGAILGTLTAAESTAELLYAVPLLAGGAASGLIRAAQLEKIGRFLAGEAEKEQLQGSAASVRTAVTLRVWARYMRGIAASLPQMSREAQETMQAEELALSLCESCERKRECWNDRFEITRKYMFKLLEAADSAEPSAVIEQARLLGCVNIAKLEPILRKRRSQNALRREEEAQRLERRTLSAVQIQGTAEALDALSGRLHTSVRPDDAAYRRGNTELVRREIEAKVLYAVEVEGRKEIMMIRTGSATAEELRRVADIACGVPMQPGAYETLAKTEVLFEQSARLEVNFCAACRKKDGESVAGDGYIARPLSGGRYLLALSDGMGSGEEAHRESQATLHLLWQCLCAGYTRSQALLAVNGILLSCAGSEMFATMDLCLIDLHTGEAAFEKLGACTSYVVRGSECRAICADTLPMGVLTRVEPRSLRMHLMEGDLLVMVSDGIADHYPDGESGVRRALVKYRDEQPREICDALLGRTLRNSGERVPDDMTVICARIQASQNSW